MDGHNQPSDMKSDNATPMDSPALEPSEVQPSKPLCVKVFGVGRAGIAVMQLLEEALPTAEFVAVGSNAEQVRSYSAAASVCLEPQVLRALGTWGDPERGRAAAEANFDVLKAQAEGVDVAVLVAGLGHGAGTGISPVLAKAAKQAGALVLAFVTTPFRCEGKTRCALAADGLRALRAQADGVICLENEKIFRLIDQDTTVAETFQTTRQLLADAVGGFCRWLLYRGPMEVGFEEVCELLKDQHSQSVFAVAEAAGPDRCRILTERLLSHPMLDNGAVFAQARSVLISLTGGPELSMAEVNSIVRGLGERCPEGQISMGTSISESMGNRISATVVVAVPSTSPATEAAGAAGAPEAPLRLTEPAPSRMAPEADRQIAPPRLSGSREVPSELQSRLNEESAEGGSRSRKNPPRTKQAQAQLSLPLVSRVKGKRFENSEPTMHNGEDLDVPTYVRRNIVLN
jgi:cell division protein FtsZ